MKRKYLLVIPLLSFIGIVLLFNKPAREKLIGGIFKEEQITHINLDTANIIFGGDLMFDRYIRQIAQSNGYDYSLEQLRGILINADAVVANLEGPITDNTSISIGSEVGSKENYVFTFDPLVAQTLYDFNIKTVNIGNNHILNFSYAGLEQTLNYLADSHVDFFGDINTYEHSSGQLFEPSIIKNINGIKVKLISYNQFSGNGKEKIIETLRSASDADYVIVLAHWGTEYTTTAGAEIQDLAHKFIDNGADLVIGGHPHVIQQIEDYKGKRIYYSLGNFVADQYFEPDVQKGILVDMKIEKSEETGIMTEFDEIYIYMDPSGKTTLKD